MNIDRLETIEFGAEGRSFARISTPEGKEWVVNNISGVVGIDNKRALLIEDILEGVTIVTRIPHLVELSSTKRE